MNIEQLKTLAAVVESGSINAAAQLLFKTQPAVSMAIKKLESEIGFNLFDRNNYRLQLTAKGEIYYKKSKQILGQLSQLKNLSDSYKKGEEHQVTIAVEGTTDLTQIFNSIKPVQQQFPNTEIIIQGVHMLNGLERLQQEQVELTITPWLITFESTGQFDSKKIDAFSFFLCGHKDLFKPFGITNSEQITEEILAVIPQITPTKLAMNLDKTELLRPISQTITKIDDIHCFLAALQAKLGWGPITSSAWNNGMAKDFFKFSLQADANPYVGDIRIVKNKNKLLGPAAKAIWDSFHC